MASPHSASIRRRLTALTEAARRAVEHRQYMRENAEAAASIRAALAEANIDPAQNGGFRYFAYAERVVSEWPDRPELQRVDAVFIAQDPELAARRSLAAEAARHAPRFAGQPPPRPGASSPFDWYAWSLAARSEQQSDPR
jgi:hypothetical protein